MTDSEAAKQAKAKARRLAAEARKLGLTQLERRFAEAMARDPERNQTRAAKAAGYKNPRDACGIVWKRPSVKKYFDMLTEAAQEIEAQDTANAVLTLASIRETVRRHIELNLAKVARIALAAATPDAALKALEQYGNLIEAVIVKDGYVVVKAPRRAEMLAIAARLAPQEVADPGDGALLVINDTIGELPPAHSGGVIDVEARAIEGGEDDGSVREHS